MKNITDKEALTKALEFITRMVALHKELEASYGLSTRSESIPGRTAGETREQMHGLLHEVDTFDESLGQGLRLGRLESWDSERGPASYFVTGIGRREVRLIWLPGPDRVTSPVVAGGRALRLAVERALHAKDWLRANPGKILVVDDN
jgi:hypothetical protein